jgi:hypothetical protein
MLNSINNIQSLKRKQPIDESTLFLAPSIPAKRSNSFAMFFPKIIPSNGSIVMCLNSSKLIQTDQTSSLYTSSLEQEELISQINDLRRAKTDLQYQYESTVDTIKRCLVVTRSLLIDKSQLEKKQVREKTMENRLRLGQFLTQRQGTSFVEQWIDGYDFSDKRRAQEQLGRTKKNLNKERKNLTKKKTFLQQQQQLMMTNLIDETNNYNSNFNFQDISKPVYVPPIRSKRINKNSTTKTLTRYIFVLFCPEYRFLNKEDMGYERFCSCNRSLLFD